MGGGKRAGSAVRAWVRLIRLPENTALAGGVFLHQLVVDATDFAMGLTTLFGDGVGEDGDDFLPFRSFLIVAKASRGRRGGRHRVRRFWRLRCDGRGS